MYFKPGDCGAAPGFACGNGSGTKEMAGTVESPSDCANLVEGDPECGDAGNPGSGKWFGFSQKNSKCVCGQGPNFNCKGGSSAPSGAQNSGAANDPSAAGGGFVDEGGAYGSATQTNPPDPQEWSVFEVHVEKNERDPWKIGSPIWTKDDFVTQVPPKCRSGKIDFEVWMGEESVKKLISKNVFTQEAFDKVQL